MWRSSLHGDNEQWSSFSSVSCSRAMPAAVKRWIDGEFPQCVPAKALLSPLWQQLMPDKHAGFACATVHTTRPRRNINEVFYNPCPCGFFLNFFCKTTEFARNKISMDSGILVLALFLSGRHGSNLTDTPERNKPSSLRGLGRQTSRSFQNRWQYTLTTIRLRGQRKHAVHLQRIFCQSLWIYSCIAPEIT